MAVCAGPFGPPLTGLPTHALHRPRARSDVGGPGMSLGDEAIGFSDFFQNGRKVGTGGFVCTVVSLQKSLRQCQSTLRLTKGDITLQGFARPRNRDRKRGPLHGRAHPPPSAHATGRRAQAAGRYGQPASRSGK